MRRTWMIGTTVIGASLLAACGASTTGGTPTPAGTSAPAATPTATPASTPTASQTAVPTSLDPCQVVPASEASSVAGVSFATGKEETYSGNGKGCVYGAATLNVFTVIVAVAPDAATAQADWVTEEAQVKATLQTAAQGHGINVSSGDVSLSGADKAAVGTGSASIAGVTLAASVIYFLKGATFVSFSDLTLGHTAPSAATMEAEAQNVIGRLP